jgi:hypothetical protein
MNFLAMMGPKTANGSDDMKTSVTIGPLCLFGTSSPRIIPNESCPAAATPLQALAAIRVSIVCAVPPTIFPTILSTVVPMTIHLRPKISLRRPTKRKPIADPRIQTVPTQPRFGDGPMSAFMRALRCCQHTALQHDRIYCSQSIGRQNPTKIGANATCANRNHRTDELDAAEVAFGHFMQLTTNGMGINNVHGAIRVHHLDCFYMVSGRCHLHLLGRHFCLIVHTGRGGTKVFQRLGRGIEKEGDFEMTESSSGSLETQVQGQGRAIYIMHARSAFGM